MKRLLLSLLLILGATSLFAQVENSNYFIEKNAPANAGINYSGTAVLGDIIYFNGTNWVSLNKPADGTYNIHFASSIPSYTAAGSGTTVATDAIWTTPGQLVYSTGNAAAAVTAVGTAGQSMISGGAGAPAFGNATSSYFDPSKSMFLYDDFLGSRGSATSACNSTIAGLIITNTSSATGTNASLNYQADANHQGVCEYDLGTANAAAATVLSTTSTATMYFQGNEVWQAAVYLSALSNSSAGDTYRMQIGPCNVTTGATCTHGAWFEYTDSVNSGKWTIKTAGSGGTTTQNTSTAPTAAWHVYTITVNAATTAVHFYIDGAEVANSPNTTNIPTAVASAFQPISIGMIKTLGTAASYAFGVDYVYFARTGLTR